MRTAHKSVKLTMEQLLILKKTRGNGETETRGYPMSKAIGTRYSVRAKRPATANGTRYS
ncbi:hypothetical protein [Trichormus variabilis]|uniref:hypothetical protein n=1 Tax=Anabaena variabilis TaxID=264691 RepID=UPI001687FEB8|nr:hypothetical protein [Trichormus variabilis]MBD2628194.1 hypothetical protein [Trichormus variabilis FACHB-164]